jgi:molybdate transport system permease protein
MILFTIEAALLSTACILPFGVAIAWLLARHRWRGKTAVETIVALPLVLPPVATGLILLTIFGRSVAFTWRAVVLAMMVMSFPLLVRAARVAFEDVSARLEQIARTLGASEPRVFFTITLPLAMRGVVSGAVLAFARALGEFGATIVVAGNIPGRTQTLALSIYDHIELGHDAEAWRLLAVSVAIAFAAVWISERIVRREARA